MRKNRLYIYRSALLVILCFWATRAVCQGGHKGFSRGPYAVVAYLGGGLSYYSGLAGTPAGLDLAVTRLGPVGTARVLWHPDHHLFIGLESGWTTMYSYRSRGHAEHLKMNLTAVPMLLVVAMPVGRRFLAIVAPGGYLLTSRLDYDGIVNSPKFSFGWMIAASYKIPLSKRFSLLPEVKFMNARETKDATLSLQLMAAWKIYEW